MKNGIICLPCVEYAVAAAIHDEIAPASLMPSWSIWPVLVFAVPHQLIGVLRTVELSERLEYIPTGGTCLPCRRCASRPRRSARGAGRRLVANQRADRARVRHRRRELALAAVFEQRFERVEFRHRQRLLRRCAGAPGTGRRARLRARAGTSSPGCLRPAGCSGMFSISLSEIGIEKRSRNVRS